MTRHALEKRFSRHLASLAMIGALATGAAMAAPPEPFLSYDFGDAKDGIVSAGANKALDLRVPASRDGAVSGTTAILPVVPDEAASWLSDASPDEFSAGFWIRFDKLPSQGTPTGLFDVSADKEGFVTIRLFAEPTEFNGDYRMRATTAVKKGEWHHVEFTYSRLQWRASLYLDGRFQWENDNLNLPALRYGPLAFVDGFRGAIRDFRCYDMALPSEYLAIAQGVPEACARLKERARAVSGKSANSHLRTWMGQLAKEAETYAARSGRVTIGQMKDLERKVANGEKLVRDIPGSCPGHIVGTPATVYTVNPLSQEPYLPDDLPRDGRITGQMRIAATRGEYENGSALVVAFKPIVIRNVSVSDLRGPGGKVIKSSEIDVRLVKRWFRSGGAWLSYHSDRRQRNLVPDLLVHDDGIVRVDEWRRRNYLRLDYPEGRRYVDVSDPEKGHRAWKNDIPLHDAETLRPVKIAEAGRNKQFLFTVHVPPQAESGLYKGTISFEGTDAVIQLIVRVLPFDLPTQPSPYRDVGKTYISHLNSMPDPVGPTPQARRDYIRRALEIIRAHNAFHTTGIWDSKTLVDLSLAAGFVPDKIFGKGGGYPRQNGIIHDWLSLYPGAPLETLTSEDKKEAMRIALASGKRWRDFFDKNFPAWAEPYVLFFSESSAFTTLSTWQAERAEVAHALGQKVFAHGWNKNLPYAGAIQDMHSVVGISREEADGWHSAGGEVINYSDPFPGQENPVWFRRKIGMRMYKAGYDGQMLHGFLNFRAPWNEFSSDPGGDGNYRNFCMAYPVQDGFICKLAFEGFREAYDDVRYATRLRQIALASRDSEDLVLRRESRRQLLWLEQVDGEADDLDMIRTAIIARICLLQELVEARKGVLPPADKVASR